eukprot:15481089-Alexandrium_andersonii.AAC.1
MRSTNWPEVRNFCSRVWTFACFSGRYPGLREAIRTACPFVAAKVILTRPVLLTIVDVCSNATKVLLSPLWKNYNCT